MTHWSMSEGASKTRGTNGITRESIHLLSALLSLLTSYSLVEFTEAWITTLGKRVPLKSEDMIPFVFLDNQVALKGSAHLTFDAIEQECFEVNHSSCSFLYIFSHFPSLCLFPSSKY